MHTDHLQDAAYLSMSEAGLLHMVEIGIRRANSITVIVNVSAKAHHAHERLLFCKIKHLDIPVQLLMS